MPRVIAAARFSGWIAPTLPSRDRSRDGLTGCRTLAPGEFINLSGSGMVLSTGTFVRVYVPRESRTVQAGQWVTVGTVMATLLQHRDGPIPTLSAARGEVPAELDTVFRLYEAVDAALD